MLFRSLPLFRSMKDVAKVAVLMYAASATRSDREAAALLGITRMEYKNLVREYNIINYFEGERNGYSTDTSTNNRVSSD